MPDLDTAMEVIDMWAERYLEKPNSKMSKSEFRYCCEQHAAIDILKEHLKEHWFEAPSSDLIYNFIKQLSRLKESGDYFWTVVYKIVKEIFYYFI